MHEFRMVSTEVSLSLWAAVFSSAWTSVLFLLSPCCQTLAQKWDQSGFWRLRPKKEDGGQTQKQREGQSDLLVEEFSLMRLQKKRVVKALVCTATCIQTLGGPKHVATSVFQHDQVITDFFVFFFFFFFLKLKKQTWQNRFWENEKEF